ncbi:hypothetical protein WDU94_009334 [Cyamophila willieti]
MSVDGGQHEFLPLCDVLFNIISLAAYFCDIVFDIVLAYALYSKNQIAWFTVSIFFVLLSLVVEQIVSIRWYLHVIEAQQQNKQKIVTVESSNTKNSVKKVTTSCVIALHVILFGILWRYFKLFIPVDLRYVKYEVRDLCVLRLLHAFCESAPMLLLQSYLLWLEGSSKEYTVSTIISLFNVCWALASFSKNVRMQNVHRLVLTWLGVIFQFLWRLGTVGARILSLAAYATVYNQWVFLVLGSHWLCMLLWLTSPKNVFHGEHISKCRKAAYYSLIAFIYTFAYINLIEISHRQKMIMFYLVMGLENGLLVFVWSVGVSHNPPWYYVTLPLTVFLLFFSGLGFMLLYYQYFHVRRLKYEAGGRLANNDSNTSTARLNPDARSKHSLPNDLQKDLSHYSTYFNGKGLPNENGCMKSTELLARNRYPGNASHGGIPGVFNCRFTNPYMAAIRKKKKPTSFVPPPCVPSTNNNSENIGQEEHREEHINMIPFWCRPLPQQGGSSETESTSQGHRVDIQQKLQEKKQKQLAELKVIEEEIKQGKHQRPGGTPTPLEPPPPPPPRGKQPPQSNNQCEILLTPYYLENEQGYYDWNDAGNTAPMYRLSEKDGDGDHDQMYKSYRMASDLDSQVSLPRSYTLPRQFKYYRKPKHRKPIRTEHFIASTNSSDGDVDSADENESDGSSHTASQLGANIRLTQPMFRTKHETKL